jgi:hypothetical protein
MHPITGGLCSVCGERLASPFAAAGERCGLCRRAEPPFAKAVAYGSYDGRLRELIHLQPNAGGSDFGSNGWIGTSAGNSGSTSSSQTAAARIQPNGANRTRRIETDRESPLHISTSHSERHRETQSQIGLTRHQRRENMRGAFVVAKPDAVKARDILIVDDVFTTGTTVSECAPVLRRAGASKVYVATVARTLKAEARRMAAGRRAEGDGSCGLIELRGNAGEDARATAAGTAALRSCPGSGTIR